MNAHTDIRAPLQHFETFARLHEARHGDAAALRALSESLPAGPGGDRPVWPLLIDAIGAHVVVATECQVAVGAAVAWHRKDTADARLIWLGVAPAARGRGIGRLLLDSVVATVAAHRAMAVTARLGDDADTLNGFLRGAGFAQTKGGAMRLSLLGAAR